MPFLQRVLVAGLVIGHFAPSLAAEAQQPAPKVSSSSKANPEDFSGIYPRDFSGFPGIGPDADGAYDVALLTTKPKLLNAEELSSMMRALYQPAFGEAGLRSAASVAIVLDERGVPVKIEILRPSADPEQDAATMRVAAATRWQVGDLDGEPVRTRIVMPIDWSRAAQDRPANRDP